MCSASLIELSISNSLERPFSKENEYFARQFTLKDHPIKENDNECAVCSTLNTTNKRRLILLFLFLVLKIKSCEMK